MEDFKDFVQNEKNKSVVELIDLDFQADVEFKIEMIREILPSLSQVQRKELFDKLSLFYSDLQNKFAGIQKETYEVLKILSSSGLSSSSSSLSQDKKKVLSEEEGNAY